MAHRWTNDLTQADVTPKSAFLNRRQILAGTAGLGAIGLVGAGGMANAQDALEPNTLEEITSYNNYYEFGTGKTDPANYKKPGAHRVQKGQKLPYFCLEFLKTGNHQCKQTKELGRCPYHHWTKDKVEAEKKILNSS